MTSPRARGVSRASRASLWSVAAFASLLFVRVGSSRSDSGRPSEPDSRLRSETANKEPSAGGSPTVFREVREAITRDRVVAIAAGVTFYSLLAVFPAIAALVALYGLFADPGLINQHLNALGGLFPGGAIDVIRDEIGRIAAQGGITLGATFVVGLLASLWSANGGLKAMFDALNVVYGVTEKRGFVRLNAVSLAFVASGTLFLLLAIAAVVAFPVLANFLNVSGEARWIVVLVDWPVMLVIIGMLVGLLYRYGPSRPPPKWRWITWGSAFGAVGWLVASVLFSWYAANFGTFNKTYGSLGAVIGFMIWIWISAIVILIGAEINAAVENRERSRSCSAAHR